MSAAAFASRSAESAATTAAAASNEVAYPTRCYRALAPAQLAAACAAHGITARSPAAAYEYCEVGCGSALTLAVLAAANPGARFTGIEHDAGHARQARELVAACGLHNLQIHAADIASFETLALPRFDYITLHGVYSWVAESTRAALRRFIAEGLAPGGIAYVSYNALPGWNGVLPLRDWLQRRAATLSGSLPSRALRARDELLDLLEQRVPYFTDTPVAAAVAADLRTAEAGYIVHEYLLPGWQALAFNDVAGAMHEAGLVFAGDAELPGRALPCDEHAACRALADSGDPLAAEREHDFLHNRFFRRDLYRRTTDAASPATDALDEVLLAALVPAADLGADTDDLDPMILAGLRRLLDGQVRSYADLRAAAPLCALPQERLRRAVLTLIGRAQITPCARRAAPADLDRAALARTNDLLLERYGLLASPVSGSVVAPAARALAGDGDDTAASLAPLATLAVLPGDIGAARPRPVTR